MGNAATNPSKRSSTPPPEQARHPSTKGTVLIVGLPVMLESAVRAATRGYGLNVIVVSEPGSLVISPGCIPVRCEVCFVADTHLHALEISIPHALPLVPITTTWTAEPFEAQLRARQEAERALQLDTRGGLKE